MIVLAGWGLLVLALAALQLPFGPHLVEVALLAGAGLACLAVAAVAAVRARRRPPRADSETRVTRSGPTVGLALGVALMAFGAEAGPWLILLGAGVAALGLGGLLRERAGRHG
jgi:hypothetical protein